MKWSWHFFEITWLHMQGFCPVSDTGVPAEPTASQPGWHLSWKKQRWTPLSTLGESRQVRTETRWLALKSALLCPETGSHDGWLQGEVGLAIKNTKRFPTASNLTFFLSLCLIVTNLWPFSRELTVSVLTDFACFFNVSFEGQMLGATYSDILLTSLPQNTSHI